MSVQKKDYSFSIPHKIYMIVDIILISRIWLKTALCADFISPCQILHQFYFLLETGKTHLEEENQSPHFCMTRKDFKIKKIMQLFKENNADQILKGLYGMPSKQ
ncbi:acyl-CoA synthetase short-chain family member 3, mitochondrial [Platysternon megacephalum]|uniref:Acyl-CoA synthetase short-chain family member 3, mitochondrial n=1 Tax=Platysternon megacephalum TaxID=55544 RepID=A0A4D9ELU3_9SAUR|nr:acyl-CoA synthetase short-chain family member 3, mitochondrial [Platysternon megacephalum]